MVREALGEDPNHFLDCVFRHDENGPPDGAADSEFPLATGEEEA